ncbi:hypothetical protein D3C72_1902280 [compost metagenome]
MYTEPAASTAVPGRPRGMNFFDCSTSASLMPTLMSRPSILTVAASAPANGTVRRVSMWPNATAFTLTFRRPHSFASVLVMPRMPALADE